MRCERKQFDISYCMRYNISKKYEHYTTISNSHLRQGVSNMKLVIAEKPSLAKSIASAISGKQENVPGAIKKGDYIVTWAYGHLLTLKEPGDYDESYKEWRLDALPIFFKDWEKKINQQSYGGNGSKGKESQKERLDVIGKYLKQADMVIHAGDPDDEGQYLIDELLEYFHYKGPVKRLATGDTTEAALRKALANMDDNKVHVPAGRAAYARSVADLMVGVNLTRYFTLKNPPALLSVGRVQTPTLGLVVRRDMLIEGHKTINYYTINGSVDVAGKTIPVHYTPAKDDDRLMDGRILDLGIANKIKNMINCMGIMPCTITAKDETEKPPLPFNLVELQSYCERHWGYSPKQTLDITQSLRDTYNAISYNRTDCQYLSSNQYDEAPEVMDYVIRNINYRPKGMDMSIKSRAFDDAYIQGAGGDVAHMAIIPQAVNVDISKMTDAERNVYLAICKFYMAQFMDNAKKQVTSFQMPTPDGGLLTASTTAIKEPGYRSIFKDADAVETSALSSIPPGSYKGQPHDAQTQENATKPPPRYTQASLGKDMTRIAKYVEDPEIKKILLEKDKEKRGENGSIGTDATRADIITHLLNRGYLEEEGKKIKSTPLGRELYRILPDQLCNPDMTALWWSVQENIKNGTATPETLEQNVLKMIRDVISTEHPKVDMAILPNKYKRKGASRESLGVCPRCGGAVIEGKRGFGCANWKSGCKFVIWKTSKSSLLKNITFTASDATRFLAGKPVFKKGLYSAKKDKTFDAYLEMVDDPNSQYGPDLKLNFDLKPPEKKSGRKR